MKDEEYNIPNEDYYIDDRPVHIDEYFKTISNDEFDAVFYAIENDQVTTDEEFYLFIEEYRKNAPKR